MFQISSGIEHEFFSLANVRVRANPFFAGNPSCPDDSGATRGRTTPYAVSDMQVSTHNVVTANTENFEVLDCDLYGAGGAIIYSSGGSGSARFGNIQRNRMWNGMTSHWFDNARDIVFESNWMTGVSLTAYGNNIDSYGGGFAQHVLLQNNTYEMVWGNDREITTYDNAGGCYLGPISTFDGSSVSGVGTASGAECGGGGILVLNGTGQGQLRRVVNQSADSDGNAKWVMDKPFIAPLTPHESWIQVMPFRGRNLFVENTYRDVGAVQFYGIGLENIVAGCVGERMGGFLSWGQWRGYDHNGVNVSAPSSGGGGAGANSNIHNLLLDNVIKEGNTIVDYEGEFDDTSGGFGCFLNGSHFIVTDTTHWMPDGTGEHFHGEAVPKLKFPINSFIVFRNTRMESNSGIRIERQAEDVLIEGTVNLQTDTPEAIVTPDCQRVLVNDKLKTDDAANSKNLACFVEPSFAGLPASERAPIPAAEGGGLSALPTGGRWANPWALNESTAVFFVGNSSRLETPAEYRSDSRFGVIGYSWNVNNVGSNDSHAERWETEEAQAIHKLRPSAKVMVTREVQVIGEWYDSIDLNDPQKIRDRWFIMCPDKEDGGALTPCASRWGNNGFSPPRVTLGRWLNWSNPDAADWWVNSFVGGALKNADLDGVFFDGGGGPPTNADGISGDAGATACAQMTKDAQSAFNKAHRLAKTLGKLVTTQGAVAGAATAAPWTSTGLQPTMCESGSLLGCKSGGRNGGKPITVEACTNASRRVMAIAKALDSSGHTFQFWSQGGDWWEFPGPPPKGRGSIADVTVNRPAFDAQIALFQIARGRSALLQWHDWSFTESKDFIWSPSLDLDYGVPVGEGKEVSEGVFERQWSKRTVVLNCSAFVEELHRSQSPNAEAIEAIAPAVVPE